MAASKQASIDTHVRNAVRLAPIKLLQFISSLECGRLFLSYSDGRNFDTTTSTSWEFYVMLVGCHTLPATKDLN